MTSLVASLSCGGDTPTEVAKTAYLGLDPSIDKALALGFQGLNDALGANIPQETARGDVSGVMSITGQVDQGSSPNGNVRLQESLVGYSDDGSITYATATPPELDMSFKNLPNGTVTGTLNGTYTMTGALSGTVTLALTISSQVEEAGAPNMIQRVLGTTRVVGTATTNGGTYSLDITR